MCQVQSTILYRQYINQQVNVKPWKYSLNYDGKQFHKYQWHEQLSHTSNHWTQKKGWQYD
jgi:hypothetical protein